MKFSAIASTVLLSLAASAEAETMEASMGTGVGTSASRTSWWNSLDQAEQDKLSSLFEQSWFQNEIDEDTRIAYAYTAQQVYYFLESGVDSNPDDSYIGFAPLLLRASFHGAGTFSAASGVGGSNGGTIFNHAELADEQNGCIATATTELFSIFHGTNVVPLADTVVIAGVVALDAMEFPRMDLLAITGGRDTIDNLAHRDQLPSADDDPMEKFTKQYDLTLSQAVALAGGAHNFGSAHGQCSGYVGQWTASPLSWYGPQGSDPTFFTDLLRDDWRWYEVCTYENNTVNYLSVEDPFANGLPEEEEEHGSDASVCAIFQSQEPKICEEQAMRGCDFADGSYLGNESPCDINLLQMRLKSDFFLKANPDMLPFATAFAEDPEYLAEEFGLAYHKITHNGLDRCGLSGHGCPDKHVCQKLGDDTMTATCVYDDSFLTEETEPVPLTGGDSDDDDDQDSLFIGLLAAVLAFAVVILTVVALVLSKVNKLNETFEQAAAAEPGSTMIMKT